jgi:SIR2-like protein
LESNKRQIDDNWTDLAWQNLLYDIDDKKCIPFIGPGASAKWIQLDEIAKDWAVKGQYPYPQEDSLQLPQVAQFLAIQEGDESIPKKMLSRLLRVKPPNFSLPEHENTVYSVLADLHLPIYITTNYDHLMEDALRSKGKAPVSDYCVWKEPKEKSTESYISDTHFDKDVSQNERPSSAKPLVFHLLGDIDNPTSMVLTQRDYINFAIYLSKMGDRYTLPHSIRQTLSNSTLLFIGYRLEDLSFLIVFEGFIKLMSSLDSKSIAVQVQMSPKIDPEKQKDIRKYLDKFTDSCFKIRIYWDDQHEFLQQLRSRVPRVSNK